MEWPTTGLRFREVVEQNCIFNLFQVERVGIHIEWPTSGPGFRKVFQQN